jgi:hypothetical protein
MKFIQSNHIQYTERGGGDINWGIQGEYPFADGDVQSSMILDKCMKLVTKKTLWYSCIHFVSVQIMIV